ncbi:MAG: hypothetical protein LBF84_00350 [Holosporales bacterium]|nr:hypothetical protein [Holosporales bacterium]
MQRSRLAPLGKGIGGGRDWGPGERALSGAVGTIWAKLRAFCKTAVYA